MGRLKELILLREEAYENGDLEEAERLNKIINNINRASKNAFLTKEDVDFRKRVHKKNLIRFVEKQIKRRRDIEKDM